MGSWNSISQKKWQKAYINKIFASKNVRHKTYSKIILNNPELLIGKNTHYPKSLFKFYAPTSDNFGSHIQALLMTHLIVIQDMTSQAMKSTLF